MTRAASCWAASALAVGLAAPARAGDPSATPPAEDPPAEGPPADPPAEGPPAEDLPAAPSPPADPAEPPDAPTVEPEPLGTIIVESDGGAPRVAGSAHVIGAEQLERYGYDDITKVVGGTPGVYVRGEDGYGLRPNIGMRGANSDRSAKVTLLEDGVPMAPAPYAAPAAYYFPMSTRLVGVEVFKGPAATRHGPQTIGGAVNVLTRPVPDATTGAADLALGPYGTARMHAWGGFGSERGGVLAEVTALSTDGFKELPSGAPTGFDRQDAMLKARLARGGAVSHALELKLGYGAERSDETYLGLSAADFAADPFLRYPASDGDRMAWTRTQAELAWQLSAGDVDLRAVAWRHHLDRAWTKLNRFAGGPDLHDLLQSDAGGQGAVYLAVLRGEVDATTADQQLLVGTNDRLFDNTGVQVVAHHETGGERMGHRLELGLRVNADRVTRVHTEAPYAMIAGVRVPVGDEAVTLDSVTAADALAMHVHDDVRIGRVHVVPGLRFETVRTRAGTRDSGAVDPVAHTIALPGGAVLVEGADVDVFAGVHRGYSPVPPGSAAEVAPERAWSWEAGARATPGEAHLELTGFFSDYDDLAGACTISGGCRDDQLDRQFNGGAAWVYGVEALAKRPWHLPGHHDLGLEASYTFTHGEFRTGFVSEFPQFGAVTKGDALPYVPAHQGGLSLYLEHPNGGLALAARGRSGMRDTAGHGALDDTAIPATLALDASGEWCVAERTALYVTGTNLVGGGALESWRPYGARPAAPLQVMIGVKAGAW